MRILPLVTPVPTPSDTSRQESAGEQSDQGPFERVEQEVGRWYQRRFTSFLSSKSFSFLGFLFGEEPLMYEKRFVGSLDGEFRDGS